jgi:ATP-binding cassette, subfamily F, member 3
MVSVQNLSMHFTGEDLFTNITFLIREKDRIGLVGRNGAGKTTLLRLICGLELPFKGDVIVPEDVSLGYLPQEKELGSKKTVMDEAMTAFDEINQLEKQIAGVTHEITNRKDYESAAYNKLIERLSLLNERLALLGSSTIEGEAERVLTGLGFERSDLNRPMQEFSNGWQMRVELAKILLKQPSLLLLDEPTNHLDIESIQWLEGFLQTYYGAIVMVSHDRAFLDNITKRTIEISQGKVYDYKGSYSEYVNMREERITNQQAAYNNQQREVREIERFIERFRYKNTKSKQVQSRVKMLEKMDEIVIDDMDKSAIHFRFPPAPHSGKITVETQRLSKQYGNLQVLNMIDLVVLRGDRIAFVGRNGEGKSTLSKIIAGVLDHTGELKLGHQVSVGYYAQNQHDMLDGEKTVFETLDDVAVGEMRTRIKGLLGAFLFGGEAIDKKVKVLSGGEKSRLSLAKLLLNPVNLLVLDEPTNHLDMQSKDILKSALIRFDGTLIIVSHDRDFLQGLTNKVYEFRKPRIREHIGDIYDFLESRQIEKLDELEQKKINNSESTASEPVSQNKKNYEKRKLIDRDIRKMEREIEILEQEIAKLEKQIAEADRVLANPSGHQQVIDDEWYMHYSGLKKNIAETLESWETKHLQLDELQRLLTSFQ